MCVCMRRRWLSLPLAAAGSKATTGTVSAGTSVLLHVFARAPVNSIPIIIGGQKANLLQALNSSSVKHILMPSLSFTVICL